MGLLKTLRSKTRVEDGPSSPSFALTSSPASPARFGRDFTQRLPAKVLADIFTFVCPHSLDTSYEPSERSQVGDGCMLCDLRDLAQCAAVCRKWYREAQKLLYSSVRIDAVHYCALEQELAERRKKTAKHFRRKSGMVEAGEIPSIRLALLCRTVREVPRLATLVEYLKLPYMTRETAKGELARCVSALPNLKYVDLPDGFFTGDPTCLALRQELQARCPDIRKMSYRAGSEEALELLAQRPWQSIEILELTSLAIEPATLRLVLASLPSLHDLTLSDLDWLDDTTFQPSPGQLPDFPPFETLKLENTPHVTSAGLTAYLQDPHNRENFSSLTLISTGIAVSDLPALLWSASSLTHLSITETVSKSLSLATQHQLPPLTSISLRILHFEITSSDDVHGLQKPADSYYAYLASSLHQNALPGLTTLYVRDQSFPELLLLPPPSLNSAYATPENVSLRTKASNLSNTASSSLAPHTHPAPGGNTSNPIPHRPMGAKGFSQTLEVFSRGLDELEWVFTSISPTARSASPSTRQTSTGGRPLSAYSASRGLGPQWAQGGFGGEARKSVIVGNGFGGFLAVPQDEVPRPLTPEGRWGSVGSAGTHGTNGTHGTHGTHHSGLSWLKPPPPPSLASAQLGQDRRGSRHDLWR